MARELLTLHYPNASNQLNDEINDAYADIQTAMNLNFDAGRRLAAGEITQDECDLISASTHRWANAAYAFIQRQLGSIPSTN